MSEQLIAFRDWVISDKTGIEGGYVDHPNDLGRATKHGITQATALEYRHLWAKHNWDGNMKTLPISLAKEIYILGWWDKLLLDRVALRSQELAERLFDFGINAGRTNAVRSLQRLLNVSNKGQTVYKDLVVDGFMGQKTIVALEGFIDSDLSEGAEKIAYLLGCMQVYHYVDISEKREDEKNEVFTRGWFNRCWRDAKAFFSRKLN